MLSRQSSFKEIEESLSHWRILAGTELAEATETSERELKDHREKLTELLAKRKETLEVCTEFIDHTLLISSHSFV